MTASDLTLPRSAAAWSSPVFRPTLVDELQALGAHHPVLRPLLQAALAQTSAVAEAPIGVQVLSTHEAACRIQVHLGVLYAGVIAGCSCADDPSPLDTITEHCELVLDIDPGTSRAWATLRERRRNRRRTLPERKCHRCIAGEASLDRRHPVITALAFGHPGREGS